MASSFRWPERRVLEAYELYDDVIRNQSMTKSIHKGGNCQPNTKTIYTRVVVNLSAVPEV